MRLFEVLGRLTNKEKFDSLRKELQLQDIDLSKIQVAIQQYKNKNIVYKGVGYGNIPNIFEFDSSKYIRKSANTTNEYTLFMSNLSAWNNYPKRNQSTVCTLSVSTASGHGHRYIVLPHGNPKFGICRFNDLWGSFPKLKKGPDSINVYLGNIAKKFNIQLNQTNFTILIQQLTEIQQKIKNNNLNGFELDVNNPTYEIFNPEHSIIQNLTALYGPKENGFKLETLSTLDSDKDGFKEIWFSGPAYFIEDTKELLAQFDELINVRT